MRRCQLAHWRRLAPWLLLAACAAGCNVEDIDTTYGRRGGFGSASVNGTAVLADMFLAAGHKVETRKSLSPRVYTADTIVWFPDSYKVPSHNVTDWLEQWLASGEARTLIVVGRDFDAAPSYWQRILPGASAEQSVVIKERLDRAMQSRTTSHNDLLDDDECSWYTVKNFPATVQIRKLEGPWSEGVDASQVEIELSSSLQPPGWAEVLLASGDSMLVSRQQLDEWRESQLILVANGSFLLNLSLVNREHRKLASKLVDAVSPQGKVVFLESGPQGLRIDDKDPAPRLPSGLEVLAIWPMNAILLHLAVLGIIFCFARWPIFGTPLEPSTTAPSDFGQHVDALGDLLSRTTNREYTEQRLQAYRDGGSSSTAAKN